MSDYTKIVNYAAKDALAEGDPNKIIKGTELDAEFVAIQTAVATKANLNSPVFTGIPRAPTAATGTNTTQAATTAFVVQNGIPAGGTGIGVRTGVESCALRTITAGTGITVTNGNGVSGNPTITNSGITSVNTLSGELTIASSGGITTTSATNTVTLTPTVGYNGYGVRTVSSSAPSGGSDGDIWYQV